MSSARERAAARRQHLQQKRTITLPLPGYEDIYHVRYRILGAREIRKLGERNEKAGLTGYDLELNTFADILINACEEFLEVKGPDEFASTGHKWNANGANDLFDADLPEGSSARDAIFAVFPGTESELILHATEYDSHLTVEAARVDENSVGESQPSNEG
jgi:hypothetical protein